MKQLSYIHTKIDPELLTRTMEVEENVYVEIRISQKSPHEGEEYLGLAEADTVSERWVYVVTERTQDSITVRFNRELFPHILNDVTITKDKPFETDEVTLTLVDTPH